MLRRLALLTVFLLAAATLAGSVSAHLVPISWGFPVMVQSGSATALQSSTATASDLESANIAFPGAGIGGLFGGAFPSIAQTGAQGLAQTNLGFANQNQNMIFAYPFISIGGAPVPGMGLL